MNLKSEFKSYNEVLKHEIEILKKQSDNINSIESSVISKILDASIATVYISSSPTNNDNNYLEKICSTYIGFFENLLIVLEYFKNSEFDITRYNLNNYILSKKINIAEFDVFNLLTNHIEFAVQRESIYYKVTDKRILNDFIDDVSNELFFYKEYLQSITIEEKTNDIDTFTEKIITKDSIQEEDDSLVEIKTISISSSNEKEISEDIYVSKISDNDNYYRNTNEIIRISKDLEKNIKELNGVLNISNSYNIYDPLKKPIETLIINDITYHIIFKNHPTLPLFYYEFNSSNGNKQIIINKGNTIFNEKNVEFIILFATTLFHTKNSMTSREAEIFINRFQQNINLIK